MYVNAWVCKNVLGFWICKRSHGYAMRCRRSLRVDVGVPYAGLMVDMEMIISYIVSEIETDMDSLRTKII